MCPQYIQVWDPIVVYEELFGTDYIGVPYLHILSCYICVLISTVCDRVLLYVCSHYYCICVRTVLNLLDVS